MKLFPEILPANHGELGICLVLICLVLFSPLGRSLPTSATFSWKGCYDKTTWQMSITTHYRPASGD
jgi:hypothetical protein